MRQLHSFLHHIHLRNTKKEYYKMKFQASLHRAEIAPLDEILGVSSEEEPSPFNPSEDKAMEERALKMFEERKRKLGV